MQRPNALAFEAAITQTSLRLFFPCRTVCILRSQKELVHLESLYLFLLSAGLVFLHQGPQLLVLLRAPRPFTRLSTCFSSRHRSRQDCGQAWPTLILGGRALLGLGLELGWVWCEA